MKVSLNQVKQYISIDLPSVEQLVDRINRQLGGVEEVVYLGDKYKDAVVVKVVACEGHPDADRLSVTRVDDRGVTEDVERDEDGFVQVVCGADNVYAGMYAIWLPPGATVPETYGHEEPFVLSPKKLRGVMSNGMLASVRELGLGEEHSGIIEVTEHDIKPEADKLQLPELVGKEFAAIFGLDDTIIDIENKMFTHRPDLFGQLGVAREISAILQPEPSTTEFEDNSFINPDWYERQPHFEDAEEALELTVFNDTPDFAPRFMSVVLDEVKVESSPLWLKCELVAMGAKPVNSVVDLTNYIMLLTAQPTHAYDYDALSGQTLGVRHARSGEVLKALNGKTYQLDTQDLVIADAENPVGLAGVVGGYDSQVTYETKRVALEVANFDMYAIRKASMRHGLFTDAVTRFSKGQSYIQNDRIMAKLIAMIGARQVGPVYDLFPTEPAALQPKTVHPEVRLTSDFISQRLGKDFSLQQISNILQQTNFSSHRTGDSMTLEIAAPFWRTDIMLPEDIVEEIGRLYGFEELPRALPHRSIKPAPVNSQRQLKQAIRTALKRSGANEVLTYSFVHSDLIKRSGQDVADAYTVANALSPDLQHYRLSVLPSLLDKVHGNIKAGNEEFALFEIGKSHAKSFGTNSEGLPEERTELAVVYASRHEKDGAPYFRIKRLVEQLLEDIHVTASLDALEEGVAHGVFSERRSAVLRTPDGAILGVVGELTASVRQALKLPDYLAGATLYFDQLSDKVNSVSRYQMLSRFPSSERDINFQVAMDVTYQQVRQALQEAIDKESVQVTVEPVDIYQAKAAQVKNITVRLKITPFARTLTGDELTEIMDRVGQHVVSKTNAVII